MALKHFSKVSATDPIWQAQFYSFEIYAKAKLDERLNYMPLNPILAGLSAKPSDLRWSSDRWYLEGRTVGIPFR